MNTSVPSHVQTMGYWGQAPVEPTTVTASWVASHITLLMAGGSQTSQFKAAGGKWALGYTDPFRVSVSNHDPLWDMPEGDWLHDSTGARIHTVDGSNQNAMNAASLDAQTRYHAYTASLAASAPYDFLEVDNTYFDLAGETWGFNIYPNTPVEISSQAAWDNAVNQIVSASAIPTIIDGLSNEDTPNNGTSGTVMFVKNANAAGGLDNEGCIESVDPGKTQADWTFDENTLLATTALHKIAICMAQSHQADTNPVRNFFYASWLLSYDPTYSVAFPDIAPNLNKNSYMFVYPEYEVVPTQPVQTAVSNISELQVGSVYRREFGMCYQAQTQLAPCETIVNPTTSSQDISSLSSGYVQSMALTDGMDTWNGGKVGWTSSVPTSLGPHSAVVLLKGATTTTTATTSTTPAAAPAGSITIGGTIVVNEGNYLVVDSGTSCGWFNAFFTPGSTPITTNGLSLSAGVKLTITGTGTCSSGTVNASSIVLGSATATAPASAPAPAPGSLTINGTIVVNEGNYLVVDSGTSCGWFNAYFTPGSTPITTNGFSLSAGVKISITGSGSCSSGTVNATSMVLGAGTTAAAPTGTTFKGTVVVNEGNYIVVDSGTSCGWYNAFFTPGSTPITTNGRSIVAGTPITITGSGTCSSGTVNATSIVLGP